MTYFYRHYIKRIFTRRYIKYGVFILLALLIVGNSVFAFQYVSKNRSQLVFNKGVKTLLPVYRSVREISKIGLNIFYIPKMLGSADIPQYKLVIKGKDLRTLNKNLPSSLSDGVLAGTVWLSDEHKKTVPAKFTYEGKQYNVKVRYRGDNPNHWTRPKRSWQIKFDKDDLFEGIRTIKLIIPDDRAYFAEYLNNYRADKLGLSFPEAEYVELKINGSNHGVYYQIEDWSSESLEKNRLPADANIYSTDDQYIQNSTFEEDGRSVFEDERFWSKPVNDKIFDFENYAEIDLLTKVIQQENFSEVADDLIDLESFYKWQVVLMLAGSDHPSDEGNIRLYFNNSSGKFEFVPWDLEVFPAPASRISVNTLIGEKLFSDPNRAYERNKMLWEYVKDKDNIEDDLNFYDDAYEELKSNFYADWKKHDSNFKFDRKVKQVRQQFENNVDTIKELFDTDNSRLVIRYDTDKNLIALDFYVDNFAGLTLKSVSVPSDVFGGSVYYDTDKNGEFSFQDEFLTYASATDDEKIQFSVDDYFLYDTGYENIRTNKHPTKHTVFIKLNNNAQAINPTDIKINTDNAITGEKVKIKDKRYIDATTFNYFSDVSQTIDQFISKHWMFIKSGDTVILPSGGYYFSENIVVPKSYKLKIMPGAVLNFAQGISLVSYSPIEAIGTTFSPIVFRASTGQIWGILGVLGVKESQSTFKNTVFEGGSNAYINGVFFSGMLSAYYSDIEISDSTIEGARGDDGINVKYAVANISNNRFLGNSADAVDIDYADGVVEKNFFNKNGNDGIDISGSSILITDNYINESGDKCISIGEKSKKPIIFNNVLNKCKIGIETKDNSTPRIINNVIVNNEIGLNAYRKKEIFEDGGKPKVYNSIIWDNDIEVQDDKFSKTKIYYSDIEGGYEGEGNISVNPNISLWSIKKVSKDEALQNTDNIDMVSDILKNILDIGTASIGLIRDIK